MALIIKADIPTCCDRCFFNLRCPAYARQVTKMMESEHEQVFDVFGEMRLADCPISEIPDEHGELMDKKAFFESEKGRTVVIGRAGARAIRELYERIEKAPTVVEATT